MEFWGNDVGDFYLCRQSIRRYGISEGKRKSQHGFTLLLFSVHMKPLCMAVQMNAILEKNVHVVLFIMLKKVVLTFDFVTNPLK